MDVTTRCAFRSGRKRCNAKPLRGGRFCFFHDPDKADERKEARQAGGITRSRGPVTLAEDTPDVQLNATRDVTTLLAETINRVRRGQLDTKVGSTIGYLSGILLKSMEQGDLEERVAILEADLARTSSAGG